MASLSTTRRQIKQAANKQQQSQRIALAISAADHYTEADRAVAESFEAAEMFSEFFVEEAA